MLYDTIRKQVRAGDGLDHVRLAALEEGRWVLDLVDAHEDVINRYAYRPFSDEAEPRPGREVEQARLRDEFLGRVKEDSDASVRAAAICLVLSAEDPEHTWVERCAKRRLAWSPEQVTLLWRLVAERDHFRWESWVGLALAASRGLEAHEVGDLAPLLRTVDDRLSDAEISSGDGVAKLMTELRSHLKAVGGSVLALPESVLPPRDRWAVELRSWIDPASSPGVVDLVIHLATLTTTRPSRTWQRTCVALGAGEETRWFPRKALEALLTCEPTRMRRHGLDQEVLLDYVRNVNVARATVWAAALIEGDAVARVLERVHLRTAFGLSRHAEPRVATAVIHSLGAIEGPAAAEVLHRLRPGVFDASARKQVDAALREHAARTASGGDRTGVPAAGAHPR